MSKTGLLGVLLLGGSILGCGDDGSNTGGSGAASGDGGAEDGGGAEGGADGDGGAGGDGAGAQGGTGGTGGDGGGGSDPVCGNAIVEAGEACDDGNTESFDGCGTACAMETLGWEMTPAEGPDFAWGSMVDYGGGLVLVIARQAGIEAWRYANDAWEQVTAPGNLGSYPAASLVYDATRDVAVLKTDEKTFEYDGVVFSPIAVTSSPPERVFPGLAHDAARSRVLLFGGFTGATFYGDTWAYDGTTWRLQNLNGAPTERYGAAMTYDVARDRVVMFGGCSEWLCVDGELFDLWELDGTTWREITPPTVPAHPQRNQMAFDPVRNLSVMFNTDDGTLYEYDGSTFAISDLPGGPTVGGAATYSETLHGFVVVGPEGIWTLGYR